MLVSLYNSGDWIENRLNNLMLSTALPDMEIWCVNANSPDPRDHDIPKRYPIKYVRLDERLGVYATWNYIIKHSKGRYLTNANADDLIAPRGYERMMAVLERQPQTGFVYPNWFVTEVPNLTWEQVISGNATDHGGRPGKYTGDLQKAGVGHFPMWRRSLHDRFGYFDESFKALADADWWARCYHVGRVGFHWIPEYLACYLWRHGQNLWHREVSEQEWANYHAKVDKYRHGKLA